MLDFHTPLLNAAGTLGFTPRSKGVIPLKSLGAFITNPISPQSRKSSHSTQQIDFLGGVLLHSGYPNPGLSTCLKRNAEKWTRSQIPIIVHLLADDPQKLKKASRRLEELENVMAIELGLDPGASLALAHDQCAAAMGELPLIVRLPFERAQELAPAAIKASASSLSLSAPHGSLPNSQGDLIAGRLYGPGIFPHALKLVEILSDFGLPVVGAGGIYERDHAIAMLKAGAIAVQLDTLLWKSDMQINNWLPL